jgi:putative flippase GtrA
MRRLGRFVVVGGLATGIQYSLLFALVQWGRTDPVLASSIGFVASAAANYLMNYHYTFGSSERHGSAILKFGVLAGYGLAINAFIMAILVAAGVPYFGAQVVATLLVLFWNFAGNSLWTFRANGAPVKKRR